VFLCAFASYNHVFELAFHMTHCLKHNFQIFVMWYIRRSTTTAKQTRVKLSALANTSSYYNQGLLNGVFWWSAPRGYKWNSVILRSGLEYMHRRPCES
jgi:hypothetical protein